MEIAGSKRSPGVCGATEQYQEAFSKCLSQESKYQSLNVNITLQ